MRVIEWKLPIKAEWSRALELTELRFGRKGVMLSLTEEESGQRWILALKSVQALRATSEECSGRLLEHLPNSGALFEILDSPWIDELGRGEIEFLEKSRHFVICCYDEIVEVIAWECEVKPVQEVENS